MGKDSKTQSVWSQYVEIKSSGFQALLDADTLFILASYDEKNTQKIFTKIHS